MKKNVTQNYRLALLVLTIVGFILRLYMSHIDPFLHIWDERFHALVARNMMDTPWVPVLRNNPLFPADPTNWSQGSIWLHKQPLFMWQMTMSMKLFGATEYAIRYPSVLMGTLMIPMVFQIGKAISNNYRIAFLAAGLFCFSNFHLELVGGIRSMDHNDLCLEFYTLASVWAWVNYEQTKKKYWIVIIGFCAGAAILTKWLIGLFVFLVWGSKILIQIRATSQKAEMLRFLVALLICCLVFLPWQFYISSQFPAEAAFEYAFNRRHITEVIEGHEGGAFFYLSRFPQLLGEGIFLLVFPGLYLLYRSKTRNKDLNLPILIGVLFVFIFLSFIVKNKVISHMYFIAPFLMIYMSYGLDFIIIRLKKKYVITLFLIGTGILSAKPEKIIRDQGRDNVKRNNAIHNTSAFKKLGNHIPDRVKIVGNVPDFVSVMFYNKDIVAYESFSGEQLEVLKKQQDTIAIFSSIDGTPPPQQLLEYPYLHRINIDLKSDTQ